MSERCSKNVHACNPLTASPLLPIGRSIIHHPSHSFLQVKKFAFIFLVDYESLIFVFWAASVLFSEAVMTKCCRWSQGRYLGLSLADLIPPFMLADTGQQTCPLYCFSSASTFSSSPGACLCSRLAALRPQISNQTVKWLQRLAKQIPTPRLKGERKEREDDEDYDHLQQRAEDRYAMHQDLRSVLKYDPDHAWKEKRCPKIAPVCSWATLTNKHGVCSLKAQKWSKTHRKRDSPKKWYVPRRGNYNSSRRKAKLLIIVYANQTSSIHSPSAGERKTF